MSLEVRRKNVGRQLEALAEAGFAAYAVVEAGGVASVKALTARRGRE